MILFHLLSLLYLQLMPLVRRSGMHSFNDIRSSKYSCIGTFQIAVRMLLRYPGLYKVSFVANSRNTMYRLGGRSREWWKLIVLFCFGCVSHGRRFC